MDIGHNTPTLGGRIGAIAGVATALAASIAASLLTACQSDQGTGAARQVIWVSFDNERARSVFQRFEQACRALNVQERYNVSLGFTGVDITDARGLGAALDRVIEQRPLAIIAATSPILVEAARRTESVPIVFATHDDPIELNITPSLARQPRNLAGISYYIGLDDKMLELLRESAPGVQRIAYVVDRDQADQPRVRSFLERTARRHGIAWKVVPVASIDTLGTDLRDAGAVDAWFVTKVTALDEHRPEFVATLARTHRPVVYPSRFEVEAGGAMGYGASFDDAVAVLARQLDRVLSGVTPGEIPIERPKHFTFAVNLRAARAAGMQLTPDLISRADLVQ